MNIEKLLVPHASYDQNLTQNIVVPAGQVWRIIGTYCDQGVAGGVQSILVDGKYMLWQFSHAAFCDGIYHEIAERFPIRIQGTPMILPFLGIVADEGQIITSIHATADWTLLIEKYSSREWHNRETPGGTDAKIRSVNSICRQVTNVAIGATVDIRLVTNSNPAGWSGFPYSTVAPPQRKLKFLGMTIPVSDVVGTNLARNGLRVVLEGRELISPAGVVTTPLACADFTRSASYTIFFHQDVWIDSFMDLAIYQRVTSTDAGAQDATLECMCMFEEHILD